MEQTRRLLTPEQVAEQLAISRAQVYLLLRQGQLTSVKIGRLRRIPVDALDAFVAANTHTAAEAS